MAKSKKTLSIIIDVRNPKKKGFTARLYVGPKGHDNLREGGFFERDLRRPRAKSIAMNLLRKCGAPGSLLEQISEL